MNGSQRMSKAEYEAALRADKAKANWPDIVAGYIKTILGAVGPVQWEYRCFGIGSFPEKMLNQAGDEGWELVTVLSHHRNASVVEELYIMKRLVRGAASDERKNPKEGFYRKVPGSENAV